MRGNVTRLPSGASSGFDTCLGFEAFDDHSPFDGVDGLVTLIDEDGLTLLEIDIPVRELTYD